MNHDFADHFANSRNVTIWIRIINMHRNSLVFYAVHLHVFLKKNLPALSGSPTPDWVVCAWTIVSLTSIFSSSGVGEGLIPARPRGVSKNRSETG